MNFLQTLWPFSRTSAGVGIGADGSPPVPPATDTDVNSCNTGAVASDIGGVSPDTGAVPASIGVRPVIAGGIVWNHDARSWEWLYPEGSEPPAPQPSSEEDVDWWFPEDATERAEEFYAALIAWGYGNHIITCPYLRELYKVMCHRLRLEPGPWIKVGAELRRITNGRKTYRRDKLRDGTMHRMRTYHIPLELPAQEPLILPGLPGGPPLKQFRVPSFDEARAA